MRYNRILVGLMILLMACGQSQGIVSDIYQKEGLAIGGYDPVAYFKAGRQLPGNPQFEYEWKKARWQFSSAENLQAFREAPEQYAPQYGGYCAYGVSENHKSPTEPEAWTIVNGKLYLNYNLEVKSEWTKDIPGRIRKADSIWTVLK